MASYYYLIPSLPELTTGGEMPITYDAFLELCESAVSRKTYQLLESLTLASDEGPLVKEWASLYGGITRELNYQRSMNLGRNYKTPEDKDYEVTTVVASALAAKNPLEAEKILLDYEFACLDSLVGLHHFDDYVLFGYAIKLKLLERQSCFDHRKGSNEFKRLFEQVRQRVNALE